MKNGGEEITLKSVRRLNMFFVAVLWKIECCVRGVLHSGKYAACDYV
jgi:hypothetical protein